MNRQADDLSEIDLHPVLGFRRLHKCMLRCHRPIHDTTVDFVPVEFDFFDTIRRPLCSNHLCAQQPRDIHSDDG